jgi:Asp-tRNA(Asn)/Glu-tRNA(Gln) amidotransferase B subunit
MRSKEDAHDYRYFPDPDLPPLVIDETWIERVRSAMPEMPESMRVRFTTAYGLTADTAKLLASDKSTAQFSSMHLQLRGSIRSRKKGRASVRRRSSPTGLWGDSPHT